MASDDICKNPNCKQPILVSIFKGGDYCSVNCQKEMAGEKKVPSRVGTN